MSNIEKAINKAIEGGWKNPIENEDGKLQFLNTWRGLIMRKSLSTDCEIALSTVFLNPLFWQALGKAEGWGVQIGDYKGDVHVNHQAGDGQKCNELCQVPSVQVWHRFIDHLAEGKYAEEFFKSLLK